MERPFYKARVNESKRRHFSHSNTGMAMAVPAVPLPPALPSTASLAAPRSHPEWCPPVPVLLVPQSLCPVQLVSGSALH